MRNNRTHRGRTFYDELSPLARAIAAIAPDYPAILEPKNKDELLAKQAAKRQRRADRARHAGQMK